MEKLADLLIEQETLEVRFTFCASGARTFCKKSAAGMTTVTAVTAAFCWLFSSRSIMSCSLFSAFSPVPGRPQICAAEQIIWDEAHKLPPIVDEPGVPHGPHWPTPHEVDMPDAFMDPDIENYFVVSKIISLCFLSLLNRVARSENKASCARLFTLDLLLDGGISGD